jgi:hypothetical protein
MVSLYFQGAVDGEVDLVEEAEEDVVDEDLEETVDLEMVVGTDENLASGGEEVMMDQAVVGVVWEEEVVDLVG